MQGFLRELHTQMGFVVIPGSKHAAHITDNPDIFNFTLTLGETVWSLVLYNHKKPNIMRIFARSKTTKDVPDIFFL